MTREEAKTAKTFLHLKYKAAAGAAWNKNERAILRLYLEREGDIGTLAACCILASQQSEEYGRALEVVRTAIEHNDVTPYVELSLYEALICVESEKLAPFRDAVLSFIERSLTRRTVNLGNTIVLLGRLVRIGESHALALLSALTGDEDAEIRGNALQVLKAIRD